MIMSFSCVCNQSEPETSVWTHCIRGYVVQMREWSPARNTPGDHNKYTQQQSTVPRWVCVISFSCCYLGITCHGMRWLTKQNQVFQRVTRLIAWHVTVVLLIIDLFVEKKQKYFVLYIYYILDTTYVLYVYCHLWTNEYLIV